MLNHDLNLLQILNAIANAVIGMFIILMHGVIVHSLVLSPFTKFIC